ncbi:NAD-binding lipoprotein [Streptomyces solincola]|uniref:NAD-binding lipoprotein n=1 Tax=Streptomyces solincola TaxID=2100817 RepID=A0A2S9PSB7_9ACTN|nr:NAD-binding lipoprotein [Streptomyces solincola]PRH77320.1 NAD-binding lipoprotein [Streptomyces solincola]
MAHRRTPLGDRARYWFDSTLARGAAALVGWLALLCLAVVVPSSAVMAWTDPDVPASLPERLSQVWRLTGEALRLGGATGTPLRVVVSVLLALVTLLYVSTLVGLITTALTDRLTALRRGRSTVLETGHAVVLGWSEQVLTVVGELVVANARRRRAAVAVLADRDKTLMEEALRGKVGPPGRTRLICRSGPTTDPAVLLLGSPSTAGVVLVLPQDDPDADAEVVKTLLALRAALADQVRRPPVVAAVRDDRYRLAAGLAAGPDGVVLECDALTARLVVQAARRPGLSLVHRELLDFAGDEFHLVPPSALADRPFGDALLSFPASSVVGLVRAGVPLLNPPPLTPIDRHDRLVVISRDADSVRPGDCADLVEESAVASGPAAPPQAERILLLGWNRRAPLVLDQLRRGARPGSAVDVVVDHGEAESPEILPAAARDDPLRLTLHHGDITMPDTLASLDVHAYDSVIVLGRDRVAGQPPDAPDHRTLITLLLLRRLEEAAGRELPVVTELVDDRNRALVPVGPGADVIISGKLIGLLMAQISQYRHLAPVFEELFSAEGAGVQLRPASDYVLPGRDTAFATVVASARRRDECAIGYRSHHDVRTPPDFGVRINPPKSERRRWTSEDQVIVIGSE